jgi:hypothetical protein
MKLAKIAFVVLIVASLFVPTRSVHADVAPPPAPQIGGLEPFQYQTTNVQMVYERVEMEIQSFTQFDEEYTHTESRVRVNAYFTMHNNGNSPESMQAIFPMESFTCEAAGSMGNSYTYYQVNQDSFDVVVDGADIPIHKVVTEHPHKGCPQMTWAGFDVSFPIDEDVVIRVQYVMESMGADSMQNIEYILETGAGWAGPIKRGYVVIKFPYVATTENVLAESTPGYQFLYSEIFWSFENLEPTSENNIQISIVSPDTWQRILTLRRELKENPSLPDNWLELAQIYEDISIWHGANLRSEDFHQKIASTYEQGIAFNPNNANLYSNYAQFKLFDWSPYLIGQLTNDQARPIISLLNKALALDPNNEMAKQALSELMGVAPSLTFTPPATIPPTATSLFTATPSVTLSATIAPTFTEALGVIYVVQTKLVYPPTSTPMPKPSETITPMPTTVQTEPQKGTNTSSVIFGMLGIFVAGIGSVWFLLKRQKK